MVPPPHPDDDPDIPDTSELPIAGAYMNLVGQLAGRITYVDRAGRLLAVENRRRFVVFAGKPGNAPAPVPASRTKARGRERRDSTRRSSSRSSSSSDDPGGESDAAIAAGRIIKTRLAELGLSYRECCALTAGVVAPSTLTGLISGDVQRPYTRTKATLARALKMHVTDIWPTDRRAA